MTDALHSIPAFVHQLEIRSRRYLAGFSGGTHGSLQRGQGLEFAELRAYQNGDDLRHLDPSASARSGRLQVRSYREERNHTVLLLADLSRSTTPAKRQVLNEAVALLCFAAALQRDRIGLLAFSDQVEFSERPRSGLQQARHLLHRLLDLQPRGGGTDLAIPLSIAEGALNQRALVILLSDCHARLPREQLGRVAARHELLCFIPRDPAEQSLASGALLQLQDAESQRVMTIDAGRQGPLSRPWQAYDQRLAAALGKLGIEHLFLPAGHPAAPRLITFFRWRGGRG